MSRLLFACYALFAVAAGARSAYQLATRFDEAPVAYLLSAVAALIYIAAALALRRGHRAALTVAAGIELTGVLLVGALSGGFPDETVWSDFGAGYGYLPLVLPIAALAWLTASRPSARTSSRGLSR